MSTSHFGPVPTIWHPNGATIGWRRSRDLMLQAKPETIQIHSWAAHEIAETVRKDLPGVRILVGVGIDGVARDVGSGRMGISKGVETLVQLAEKANRAGAEAIVWNAEAAWKVSAQSNEGKRLADLISSFLTGVQRACPNLLQWHTAYDHPHYHSSYMWQNFLGPDSPVSASLPQVYAAPGEGVMARRKGLERREERALDSWAIAVRKGWIKADAPEGTPADVRDVDWHPYYQAHHVSVVDTVESAVGRPTVCLWAYPTRSDRDGELALLALCALKRLGYWKRDGVKAFQKASGLKDDGVVGPMTLAALGISR